MSIKETILATVAALVILLATGVAQADTKINLEQKISNIGSGISSWLSNEIEKTKAYQKKVGLLLKPNSQDSFLIFLTLLKRTNQMEYNQAGIFNSFQLARLDVKQELSIKA